MGTSGTMGSSGAQCFEVQEVLLEPADLLVLSLGFASAHDPLDILHFVCGRSPSGQPPRPVEDELYIERTDQDLACTGRDVVRLAWEGGCVVLALTQQGMQALGLAAVTRFCFHDHPELAGQALAQLMAMAALGHAELPSG